MAFPSNVADTDSKTATTPLQPDSLDGPLDSLVGYALRRAQMKMTQQLVDDFRPFDLRPAQFAALATIEGDPGMTQAELARALAIEPPQLVILLNKLESRGLAARIRCKTDKRSYGIFLSKPGEVLLKQLKAVVAKSDIIATSTLSAAERGVLLSLLHKICQNGSTD